MKRPCLAILLAGIAAVLLLVVPGGALAATHYTIVDEDNNTIPDLRYGGTLYLDEGTDIAGELGAGDTLAVAIDAPTTWHLTAANAGTIIIQGYDEITFTGIVGLIGSDNDDSFVFASAASFGGTVDGGGGTNTLDFSAWTTGVTVNLATGGATSTTGISSIQNVIGSAGNDTLTGDAHNNVFTGGPGKDIIAGGTGTDTLVETRDANLALSNTELKVGGLQEDKLSGIEAARLTGGPGANTLNASTFTGSVMLDGGPGNDTLTGGPGSDVLNGGEGDDSLTGGAGNDEYTGGPGTNTITEAAGGGTGDTVRETCDGSFILTKTPTETTLAWTDSFGPVGSDTSLTCIENLRVTGGAADNVFTISPEAHHSIWVDGGAGYDSLVLGPYSDEDTPVVGSDSVVVEGLQSVYFQSIERLTIGDDLIFGNRTPILTALIGPIVPVPAGASVTISGHLSDADADDTHLATWDWGDGIVETNVPAPCGDFHRQHYYTAPGVHRVEVMVDDGTDRVSEEFCYVVVYDPTAGFVTGGGWIVSPAGAYAANPELTGKATFGFEAKYKKGAGVPIGNTQFVFRMADLCFHSTSYDWLVVAGSRAQYKGTGTINGTGLYGFMLTAVDGGLLGGDKPDLFRIKIWDKASGALIYDNQMAAGDDAAPTTVLGGGSIVVHR